MAWRVGCIAAVVTLLPIVAFAVDVSDPQRAELRERAAGLQAQRAQNPRWDGGTTRLNDSRGDVKLDRPQGEVNMKSASERKAKRAGSHKPGKRRLPPN